jgi:predicted nucleic acid-binding protein
MSAVFADTFFFLALVNPRDAAHAKAVAVATSLTRPLITTAWIITELADGLASTADRRLFADILADLKSDPANILIPADQALLDRGIQLYLSRPDKKWSLTDCISFVVMQDHQVHEALTGDHHFEQAGFVCLLK